MGAVENNCEPNCNGCVTVGYGYRYSLPLVPSALGLREVRIYTKLDLISAYKLITSGRVMSGKLLS